MEILQSIEVSMKNASDIKTYKTPNNAKQHTSHSSPASAIDKVQVPLTKS